MDDDQGCRSRFDRPHGAPELISVSIVSHGQAALVERLLGDLARYCRQSGVEVILTLNVPEELNVPEHGFNFPLKIIRNARPLGFGANHNQAFSLIDVGPTGAFFVVMNPDVRLIDNPFPVLLEELSRLSGAMIAPAVLSPQGRLEDSIRRFPTVRSLAGKLFGRDDGRYALRLGGESFPVEWAAGMFMLFRAEDYRAVGGFDEDFFLYYEDVDICTRLWKACRPVLACPKAQVIHDAQRASRKNLRYMKWHMASMARYFWKHWGRVPDI